MVEMHHEPQRHIGVDLMEQVEHRHQGPVEALRMERQLFGADPDHFGASLSQSGQPAGQLGVGQHHRVAAGQQDLAQLGPPGLGMPAAVGRHCGVVGADVIGHLAGLRQTLLLDGAVGVGDLFAGDQLFAVAEPAMRRAGGDHIQQRHLVFVEQPLHRAVVELPGGVLVAFEVGGLVGGGLDQALQGAAVAGHLEVVAGDLHRHPRLDVACAAGEGLQLCQLVGRVEASHLLGSGPADERVQAVDDLAVIARVLDVIEHSPLGFGGLIFRFALDFGVGSHGTFSHRTFAPDPVGGEDHSRRAVVVSTSLQRSRPPSLTRAIESPRFSLPDNPQLCKTVR